MRAIATDPTATTIQPDGADQGETGARPGVKRLLARDASFVLILVLTAFVLRAIAAIGLERWLITRGG